MIRAVILALLLSPRPAMPPSDAPPPVDLTGSPVVAGINRMAFDLFREVRSPSGNVAVSPASLAPPIALVYEGARGETGEEIARVFHFPARDVMRRDFRALVAQWDGSATGYRLLAANSLWGQRGHAFRPEYLRLAADVYRAPLTPVDFARSPESARGQINAWVDGKTNHLIRELLAPGTVTEQTRLVVANSVYFRGEWAEPFPPEATRPADFRVATGRTVRPPTMATRSHFVYAETPEVQVVRLPYKGYEVAMDIVLPRRADGLAEVERSLTSEALDGWVAKMDDRDVILDLPKFDATTRLDLGAALGKLGMRSAFDSTADFSGIGDGGFWISAVVQQVVVKVDEKRTEAAAATAIVAPAAAPGPAAPPPPPVVFKADHPFLYVIRDLRSGTILFLGHVVDPTR